MKKKDLEQLKTKTLVELKQSLKEEQEKLFSLRLDNMRRKLENTSSLTTTRDMIARILTTITIKKKEGPKHA